MIIEQLISDWKINKSWTLFLDRDGVINYETIGNYITKVDDFIFIDGVKETIAKLSNIFNRIIIVTNQQGIGKKLMTESDLNRIHQYMINEIKKNNGRIDGIYHSPYLSSENNIMQKPRVGMGLKAQEDFPEINFSKSVMIGNSERDIIFGNKLKMRTIYIGDENSNIRPDFCIENLKKLVK
ncbi:MAG: HAD-IIIA family hydrolase [Flavobacteriales bacterium]|jgi:histidinol-phosphate phosphatase family protein|nr:HAD-IIIA family hydrolase [Flavobacteriales bacterium]